MTLTLDTVADVGAASAALAAGGARYLGGGTLLVRRANEGDVSLTSFVRVTDPSLRAISADGSRVCIGAAATMAEIAANPDLAFLAPAAHAIGGPAVRNMATVGGNLFAPAPYGDFAVALLALDATAHLDGSDIALEALLDGRNGTHARTVVTAVSFDRGAVESLRFLKVTRVKPNGISVLTIAALLVQSDGRIESARIALGNMADRPIRARAAEAALVGKPRTAEGIAEALGVAGAEAEPVDDAIASAWYRRAVLPVHLGRLLLA